ncbi:ABC transporter ATP-binding protein [Atopobacter sp. AH10]|uniref:amino acid ABC transporter ATP-binding/permease protein n=1 Tax=Atopobacter sp. AH10 TaxID=2315861 RepID=UPI000EF20134|nr:ABC transporter ATP-binding protein [Atopobacter sp. AH10]RLK63940.1 ABC transporter ATP-binding protein [Atopobacter sp. AH10]
MKQTYTNSNIMKKLIHLVYPLLPVMLVAIFLGTLGFLLSFGISIWGGYALLSLLPKSLVTSPLAFYGHHFSFYVNLLIACGILRGLFRYGEQFCNHYIAFRILAQLRHHVFHAMRKLAPAKLERENSGQLMSLIMGDIELLEVFYAHTISPIMIALLTSCFLEGYFWTIHPLLALGAMFSQLLLSVFYPMRVAKRNKLIGEHLRKEVSQLNALFLDQLKGLKEVIQYDQGSHFLKKIDKTSRNLLFCQKQLKRQEMTMKTHIDSVLLFLIVGFALLNVTLFTRGQISAGAAFMAIFLYLSSFAPFLALANLGVTLSQTLASGSRILDILEDKPLIEEVTQGQDIDLEKLEVDHLAFSYDGQKLLEDISLVIKSEEKVGIKGPSGCGKSTLLKLLMRFFDADRGKIRLNGLNIKEVNSQSIYRNIDYMTQTTSLFTGSIRDNLLMANPMATDEDLWEALRKASMDERVRSLNHQLDTRVSELADNFSSGEKQRLGLARIFLTKSKLVLLDEPTSNLDSHNEAVILKALKEEMKDRSILLVSHRASTLAICDRIFNMKDGCLEELEKGGAIKNS